MTTKPQQPGLASSRAARGIRYAPTFRYEKFRPEWTNFCEIEGPPRWIDATAKKLGTNKSAYITKIYVTLFADWKQETQSAAKEMTFKAVDRDGI